VGLIGSIAVLDTIQILYCLLVETNGLLLDLWLVLSGLLDCIIHLHLNSFELSILDLLHLGLFGILLLVLT
jgi:hypothetical protein